MKVDVRTPVAKLLLSTIHVIIYILSIPTSFIRSVISVTSYLTVLLCTCLQRPVESMEPFEIPTDIDVEFQVVKLPEERMKWLEKNTEYLAKNMDESKVKHYRCVPYLFQWYYPS